MSSENLSDMELSISDDDIAFKNTQTINKEYIYVLLQLIRDIINTKRHRLIRKFVTEQSGFDTIQKYYYTSPAYPCKITNSGHIEYVLDTEMDKSKSSLRTIPLSIHMLQKYIDKNMAMSIVHDNTCPYPTIDPEECVYKNYPHVENPDHNDYLFEQYESNYKLVHNHFIAKDPAHIIVRTLMVSDGYYDIASDKNPNYAKFQNIVSQLPFEVMTRLANLYCNQDRYTISTDDVNEIIGCMKIDPYLICL